MSKGSAPAASPNVDKVSATAISTPAETRERKTMAQFIIEPHFRLQEWVAEEKGYFRDEALDYVFREQVRASDGKAHEGNGRGAFQILEEGLTSNISCACHWTVDVAASQGHGKLFSDVYSVSPA